MKFAAILASAAVASTSALEATYVGSGSAKAPAMMEFVGADDSSSLRGVASGVHILHGVLGDNKHCEELQIPSNVYEKFMTSEGHLYSDYSEGLCPVPYTTYDAKTPDDTFPTVTHVKRGIGDVGASITVSNCGGDINWTAGSVTKGSTVTITGTGTLSSQVTSGTYSVTAKYGIFSLVNVASTPLSQSFSKDISALGTNYGTLKVTPFALPASGSVKVTIELPVPNLSGSLTGHTLATNQIGLPVFCADLTLSL